MNGLLQILLGTLAKVGDLTVIDSKGKRTRFGDGTGKPISLRFNTPSAERAVALNPVLKLGECYMDGRVDMVEGDVYDLIMLAHLNAGREMVPVFWMKALDKVRMAERRIHQLNTRVRALGNVQRHYDLSADLYRLFLDPDMQYSCAYFPTPQTSLSMAQLLKKRHIAAKLMLKEGMEVLDIGCGWGGMGLYLARVAGAHVGGVTLSEEQLAVALRRAEAEGLVARPAQDDRGSVAFRLQDYRDIDRSFDRIVSVGMFEHVGISHYDEFFGRCARMLRPDGTMLLHSIGRAEPPGATNPFLQRYIFPGGYIPALSEVMRAVEKAGLFVTDIEVLRLHYAETLRAWRKAFMARRDEARALYDEAFCRMWEFYLAGSEASFREGSMVVFQIQVAHRGDAVPITRDYIAAAEAQLESLECRHGIPGPAWPEDWPDFPMSLAC